jgi:hypothetical protein
MVNQEFSLMALGAGMDGGEQMTVQQEQVWAHDPAACARAQRRFGDRVEVVEQP